MDGVTNLLYYLITMKDLVFLHSNCNPHCNVVMDKYFDGYFTLQYVSAGAVDVSYDEERYTLTPRWFWPHYPGPRTQLRAAAGHAFWGHRYVAFEGPLAVQWAADGLLLQQPQSSPQGRSFDKPFDELLALVQRRDTWGHRRAINQLERILLDLADARTEERKRDPWLERILELIAEQPAAEFDYKKLAKQSGMALSTLRRRFRDATGTALHTYALQCRTAAARKLLGETDLSIKTIAEQLGYNDVYFFSRQFRKNTGVPPAQYRRSRMD
jgi:AraC-like DNA-binding protein